MLIIAAMMLAQAPVAGATAQPVTKNKPEQVCQYTEVTGSHQRLKVCHDKGAVEADSGLIDAPAGMFKQHPQTQPAASLGSPR